MLDLIAAEIEYQLVDLISKLYSHNIKSPEKQPAETGGEPPPTAPPGDNNLYASRASGLDVGLRYKESIIQQKELVHIVNEIILASGFPFADLFCQLML